MVPIERMSFGSAAVGHLSDGKTVFVEGAVPGDVVRVELTEEKPRFARGRAAEILEASPDRVAPPCVCLLYTSRGGRRDGSAGVGDWQRFSGCLRGAPRAAPSRGRCV